MVTTKWIVEHVATMSAFGKPVDAPVLLQTYVPDHRFRTTLDWSGILAVERGKYSKPFGILVDRVGEGMCWADCHAYGKARGAEA